MHYSILIYCLFNVRTAASSKGVVIGVARTKQPIKLVDAKHGGGRDKAIGKVGDLEKARGKHIKQDSDADEVSNSVVNSKTKVNDMLIATFSVGDDLYVLYMCLYFWFRREE